MGTRLAMVAVEGPMEGSWTLAKGNEQGIKIVHLMKGERVCLEVKIDKISGFAIFDQPGSFPIPWTRFDKYRVNKEVDSEVIGSPTTVEIILNGKTQSIARTVDDRDRCRSRE